MLEGLLGFDLWGKTLGVVARWSGLPMVPNYRAGYERVCAGMRDINTDPISPFRIIENRDRRTPS
ncbi:MAG: hypothetical protein AB7W28_01885 [Armatimonadota bacterium]|mgnify:CR=1 FL=1